MAESLEHPALFVEGDTDLHTIRHLLDRNGIPLDRDLGPVVIKKAQNDKGVLDAMRTAARASTDRPVGFVIDADVTVAQRWQAVCDRLSELDLPFPDSPPNDGFVGNSEKFRTRVGIWIMPDNTTDSGDLEQFVKTLVPQGDQLIHHAEAATDAAVSHGAAFRASDRTKAVLHCWLAWQREPGMPFGMAIKAHFFRHDSAVAHRFVAWFRELFLQQTGPTRPF